MSAGCGESSTTAKPIPCSTPCAASGFVSVLLGKTLRSSTLRLALIYVGLFAAAIIGVFGYLYWSTLSYVHAQSDRSIAAERSDLDAAFAAAGRRGVVEVIDRRLQDSH